MCSYKAPSVVHRIAQVLLVIVLFSALGASAAKVGGGDGSPPPKEIIAPRGSASGSPFP